MNPPVELCLPYPAPIPKGHRVEIVWPHEGPGTLPFWPHESKYLEWSFVVDLDAGIQHGQDVAFLQQDEGVPVGRRWVGTVVFCRLGTSGSGSTQHTYTSLWIELDPLPGG